MPNLEQSQLESFKQLLALLKDELLDQYESEKSAAGTVDLDQTKVGRLSRMDAMQQQNMAKSTMRNITERLKRISIALAKIETGDYGYCDECGEHIALNRLEVQPEAPCCFACQSQQEYHPQS